MKVRTVRDPTSVENSLLKNLANEILEGYNTFISLPSVSRSLHSCFISFSSSGENLAHHARLGDGLGADSINRFRRLETVSFFLVNCSPRRKMIRK